MNNAEKFKQIFGLYAIELWSMPGGDFLEWLDRDVETTQIDHTADISKKVSISCGRENDVISRKAAIDAIHGRTFKEIVVRYPTYTTYPERQGKPYFSIKYTENGQEFIGYSTYKPEVLSEYLKEYFMTSAQPDHVADVSKKVDMMHEYIYKIVQDCDGVNCYIKQGKIIRCKNCKHKHVENMVWTCPFGLSGGENFFCGYGTEPYKGERYG